MSINRVTLVGRLTKDPDFQHLPSGVPVATFTVAVNRPFSNKDGEREADFIRTVTWRKQAENCSKYLSKGSLVGVDGRLQTRSWEKDGKRQSITEVVAESVQFLEPKKDNQGGQQQSYYNVGTEVDPDDDSIPF